MTLDYARYLAAKTTVDDRALNRHVLVGCLLLSGLRILIGSSPERTEASDREEQEILS